MPASQYANSILMLNSEAYLLVGPRHYLKIKSSDGTMLESLKGKIGYLKCFNIALLI